MTTTPSTVWFYFQLVGFYWQLSRLILLESVLIHPFPYLLLFRPTPHSFVHSLPYRKFDPSIPSAHYHRRQRLDQDRTDPFADLASFIGSMLTVHSDQLPDSHNLDPPVLVILLVEVIQVRNVLDG